jgi:hypothetical protein
MTEEEVKAFRALADADQLPAGPWTVLRVGNDFDDYEVRHPNGLVCDWLSYEESHFIAAARNNAARLCDAALYALELEGLMHDAVQGNVPAALLADARRLEREEVIYEFVREVNANDYIGSVDITRVCRRLPPLPDEPPTSRELRERAAMLEAENARLREGLKAVVGMLANHADGDPIKTVAREALEATE